AGRPLWAHQVALASGLEDSPVMIRVWHAQGEHYAIEECFAALVRRRFPGGAEPIEFAQTLEDCGRADLAQHLLALGVESMRASASTFLPLVRAYAALLVRQGQFESAENLLMREGEGLTEGYPELLVQLYAGWNKLDRLAQELAKFHLPDGVQHEALYLAAARQRQK
ncbi:MAG: hypothetical protein ACOYMN_01780, partial [Roseimicrobium sp.]